MWHSWLPHMILVNYREGNFSTTSGRTVQVYSSVYGWKIDQEKEIETIMQEMIAGVQNKPGTGIRQCGQMHGV